MLTAQSNGANLADVAITNIYGEVTVSWASDECEGGWCFSFADRVHKHIVTGTYNGAASGTRFGMGRSVKRMAKMLGNYTGIYKHRKGYSHGRLQIEEWAAKYTGGNCAHSHCWVKILRVRADNRWHWMSEIGYPNR